MRGRVWIDDQDPDGSRGGVSPHDFHTVLSDQLAAVQCDFNWWKRRSGVRCAVGNTVSPIFKVDCLIDRAAGVGGPSQYGCQVILSVIPLFIHLSCSLSPVLVQCGLAGVFLGEVFETGCVEQFAAARDDVSDGGREDQEPEEKDANRGYLGKS